MDSIPEHLVQRFSHNVPKTGERITRHETVREAALRLAVIYDELLPPSREAALAQTALQEASMWANAALAFHEDQYTGQLTGAIPSASA